MNARKNMKAILFAGLCLLASGCAQLQEAQRQAYENRMAGIEATCVRYGFTKGSPEFSQCMMQIDQRQRAAWQQSEAARQAEFERTQGEMQRSMILRPPQTTTCTSMPIGNTIQTVCK
jgi:hypothetical protein